MTKKSNAIENRNIFVELPIKEWSNTLFKMTVVTMSKKIINEIGDFFRELEAIKSQMKTLELKKNSLFKIENARS